MIETLSVSFACHVEHVQNRFLHKLSCRAYVLTWFASVFISYVYVYYFIFWKQFLLFDRLLRFSFQTLLLYLFPCWISLKNFVRSEISSNSPRTFEAPIVLVRRNYERYFAVDARELRTQEGKFALLESLVRNLERKFALLITAKCIAPGVETTSECPKDTQDLMRGRRAKYWFETPKTNLKGLPLANRWPYTDGSAGLGTSGESAMLF